MSDESDRLRWSDACGIAGACALALVIGGYCFGREDHSTYLPMMWALQNPDAFKGDLLIESAPQMHMLFWHVMARLTLLLPTEPTFAVVHVLVLIGTCVGAFGAALALFKSRAAAYLSLALLLTPKGLFGLVEAGINSQPLLTQTNVAVCLLTLAVWKFLRNRYVEACLLVGIAFNVQGMTATFVLCMFGMFFLATHRVFGWQRLGRYAASFLVPALPTIVQIIRTTASAVRSTSSDVEQWIEIMRVRMAHHVFPLSWPWMAWVQGGLLIACFVAALRAKKREAADVKVIAFAGAIVILCAVGLLFAEALPVLPVMQFQLFRSTRFLMFFGLLYLAADCVAGRRGLEGIGSCAGIAGAMTFPKGFVLTAPLLLLYLATRARRVRAWLCSAAGLWLAAALVMLLARQVTVDLQIGVGAGCWSLFLVLAAAVAASAKALLTDRSADRVAVVILCAFALALGAGRLSRNHLRWERWTLNPLPNDSQWIDVQEWCRANTDAKATFLVPIYLDSFRCFSRRAIVGDFKDAGPHMYCVKTLHRWHQRMAELGLWEHGDPKRAYAALSALRLRAAARQYAASYVVVERGRAMGSKPLYQNAEFAVHAAGARP